MTIIEEDLDDLGGSIRETRVNAEQAIEALDTAEDKCKICKGRAAIYA